MKLTPEQKERIRSCLLRGHTPGEKPGTVMHLPYDFAERLLGEIVAIVEGDEAKSILGSLEKCAAAFEALEDYGVKNGWWSIITPPVSVEKPSAWHNAKLWQCPNCQKWWPEGTTFCEPCLKEKPRRIELLDKEEMIEFATKESNKDLHAFNTVLITQLANKLNDLVEAYNEEHGV